MTGHRAQHVMTRRAALAGLGIGGLGIALAPRGGYVIAQGSTPGSPVASPVVEGQMAPINGAELYYAVRGAAAGSPVLLLHGGLGSTEDWNNRSPDLVAAGYRVVVMDCLGRGRSTLGDAPIPFDLMVSDALALLDLLEIDAASLVGWSDGAMVGLQIAMDHPERLTRAVIHGANYTPDGEYVGPHRTDQLPPFASFVEDYQRLSPEPERFDALLAQLGVLYEVAPNFSEAELASISVPTLILDGAEEEFEKPEQTRRMAELIPGAELVIMPGTGHFVPAARPAMFNRIVLDFLEGRPIATPTG